MVPVQGGHSCRAAEAPQTETANPKIVLPTPHCCEAALFY